MENNLPANNAAGGFDDRSALLEWQKSHDPNIFTNLMIRYQPIINSAVKKFSASGMSPQALRAQATAQTIKAITSYDPTKGTQPTTHVWNSMQKLNRLATDSLMSGHIPEHRNLKMSTYITVKENLTDRLGYEPSVADMADELSWSKNEVSRMESELGGEVTASSAEFDFFGNSTIKPHEDREIAEYMYHDLSGKEKTIFEHTFGVGGKPILNNKEIAKKLNINEMAVHRMKKKMAEKIKQYR